VTDSDRDLAPLPRDQSQPSRLLALIVALASGESIREAARLSGMSERTIYRRLREDAFIQRVNHARTSMIQQAVGRLARSSAKASQVLEKLLDSNSERIRLQTARVILDSSIKLGDALMYEQRLSSLESMLNMKLPKRERQKDQGKRW